MVTVKIWGSRGSIPSPGAEKNKYGGNTSCVELTYKDSCIILDGGSGIQKLGNEIGNKYKTINILLTHLHLDHIIGLGFFAPLYNPKMKIKIWGPAAVNESLTHRLRRYFSPPIFPVRLNELPAEVDIIEINDTKFNIDDFEVTAEYICHPGPTIGYRLKAGNAVIAYIPDHEPALASANFPYDPEWTSGFNIAQHADILIHDAQFKNNEYQSRLGWGHSSMKDALEFGKLAGVKKMIFFHHDPTHTDEELQQLFANTIQYHNTDFEVELGEEGKSYILET